LQNILGPFTGSAGVLPAKLLESMPLSFFIHAGETPALPVANRWTASSARMRGWIIYLPEFGSGSGRAGQSLAFLE
jgi:hypothetical protein